MTRPNVPATAGVYNVATGICEHTGTRASCIQWIRNPSELGFINPRDYEVR